MPESFGARLRQRREEQGIALVTIARQTKIKESLLEGLERDDLTHWPSKIYRRAFVRAYADAIALDPEQVVQEFLARHPEPPDEDVLVAMASTLERANGGPRPGSAIRNVVGSAIGSLSRRVRNAPVNGHVVTNGPLNGVGAQPATVAPASIPVFEARPLRSVASPAMHSAPVRDLDVVVETTAFVGDITFPSENDIANGCVDRVEAAEDAADSSEPTPPEAQDHQPLNLLDVAHLCTHLGCVASSDELEAFLARACTLLDAAGVIVWLWDDEMNELSPAIVHGYPERVVAQLPAVRRDADNATAAAFRCGAPRTIPASGPANGAIVVPLLTADGCAGVLAIELRSGRKQTDELLAAAVIFGALLAQMIETPRRATHALAVNGG